MGDEEANVDEMQCYTELIAPSAVTHAVSLAFLNAKANNLVVAKTSLLQVFDIQASAGQDDSGNRSKLVLVGEYPLAGTVTSLASIRTLNTKSGGEALLIALKDAKLSLVEWDPDNYKISSVSIHYYEGENVINQPFGPSLSECESILTVDPSSRCAALKFGARHIAILPFRQVADEMMEAGEDGYDQEMDIAPPSATLKRAQSGFHDAADNEGKKTPYKASFVLPLTALDPALTHLVHLAFLHEYREPTFGILSAQVAPSTALIDERKDVLSYTVFTLDLEQRASTNLVSAQNLPSDLWKVVSLPLPVGGALLVGTNEFLHVDQNGKVNAVAVNEFAKASSDFGMSDQSDLNMKLEGCQVGSLDPKTGDLLIVLNDGSLAILTFRLSGRDIGGLQVTVVSDANGGAITEAAPSCVASTVGNQLFIGSEDGDTVLLRWAKPAAALSRKRSHAQMLGQEPVVEEDEDEDPDDDDLYGESTDKAKRTASVSNQAASDASAYTFELLDTLPSSGPINDICLGRSSSMPKDKLELVAGVGRGRASRVALMGKEIVPEVVGTEPFDNGMNAWSMKVKTKDGEADDASSQDDYDNLFFLYDGDSTKVYDVSSATAIAADTKDGSAQHGRTYVERTGTEFEHEGETFAVSTLAKGSRVVQCRRSEIRTYEASDLALSQIIPMLDEETDAELKVVHTSFCDPYLLVLRDDSSVQVLRVDRNGDVEPLDAEGAIKETKWLSGCLYTGPLFADETVAFLLGEEGGLHAFTLPDFEAVYTIAGLSYLPAVLAADAPQRRIGAKETLTECLVADLGTSKAQQPYLILRSAMDDLTLYEPWSTDPGSWKTNLRFRKVPLTYVPKFDENATEGNEGRPAPLRPLMSGERSMVIVPGAAPSLMVKEATSLPKILPLRVAKINAIVPLHQNDAQRGFGVLDSSDLQECQIPSDVEFSSGWSMKKLPLGDPAQGVRHVAFHGDRQMYVAATYRNVEFRVPGEDGKHHEDDGKSTSHPYCHFSMSKHAHIQRASRAYTSTSCLFGGATSIVDARSKMSFLFSQPASPYEGLRFIPEDTKIVATLQTSVPLGC